MTKRRYSKAQFELDVKAYFRYKKELNKKAALREYKLREMLHKYGDDTWIEMVTELEKEFDRENEV